MLLIAVGWALMTTAFALHLRRYPQARFGPFIPREQRSNAPRWSRQVGALFLAGIVVAVWGGADAQRHHISYWAALALVFIPVIVIVASMTALHNRRVQPEGSQGSAGSVG